MVCANLPQFVKLVVTQFVKFVFTQFVKLVFTQLVFALFEKTIFITKATRIIPVALFLKTIYLLKIIHYMAKPALPRSYNPRGISPA